MKMLTCFSVGLLFALFSGIAFAGIPDDPVGCEGGNLRDPRTPTTPSAHFQLSGDGGSVIHEPTQLEWSRCYVGQEWDGDQCVGDEIDLDYQTVLSLSAQRPGWRLPSLNELNSIKEECAGNNRENFNRAVFPPYDNEPYLLWSSTEHPDGLLYQTGIGTDRGEVRLHKGRLFRARLVRDAQ